MKLFLTLILTLLIGTLLPAQFVLKPSIGLASVPQGVDSICTIPLYLGNFDNSGLMVGDTAADFTLFDLNGQAFTLSTALSAGKPVLMVGGNYTCPVFRNKIAKINEVNALYGDSLTVLVVYGVEAHPDIDISPYFGYVNTGAANLNAGILYRQPTSYAERMAVAAALLSNENLQVPAYLDGPCNNWWQHYGPAPNNAYLIGTDGIVHAKHGWFDRYPDDILCDLDSYFNNDCTPTGGANGHFTFQMTSQDTTRGQPGETLFTSGLLVNDSNEPVDILIRRLVNTLPIGWESSLCADVCYPSFIDSTIIQLAPGQEQEFHFYFYTDDHNGALGYARVGFRNQNNTQNKFVSDVYGITSTASSTQSVPVRRLEVNPNPVAQQLQLPAGDWAQLQVFNALGQMALTVHKNTSQLDVSSLPTGWYSLVLFEKSGSNPGIAPFFKL